MGPAVKKVRSTNSFIQIIDSSEEYTHGYR